MKRKKVNLGDEVLDPISGYKGTALGITMWLYGCERITVQMKGTDSEGNLYPTQSFDEPQLKVTKKAKKIVKGDDVGGFDIRMEQKRGVKQFN